MIINLEKQLKNTPDGISENELIKEWLHHSNGTNRYYPKPIIDKHTVEFLLYSCEKLEIEKDVFFKSVDVVGKYLDIVKKGNIDVKEPVLTILVLILICNKHTGQRSDLSGASILSFMIKEGLKKYDLITIKKTEKTIMMHLKCHIPLLSTMDDMNVLIEVFVKPEQFINLIRKQCLDVLSLFYLHSKTITELLDDIYSKNSKTKSLLKNYYVCKLYIPAAVLICTLKICKDISIFDYDSTCNKISNYISIPLEDLNLLSSIIWNLICCLK